jgi:hypothetical protein
MNRNQFFSLCYLVGMLAASVSAVNNLSVRQDIAHPQVMQGYIDEAVLVVEPYGGYSLQSLYIKYSDHGRVGGNVVVTHTFELPEGAIVNDLWLWIGDSIMQGKILERKHAQGLWDTITALKHDPALLKVSESQFDLSVYPLISGSFRKVKIQMMVPTRHNGKNPLITLPYKFLCADNNIVTPVCIMFRTTDNKYGQPALVENQSMAFSAQVDTLGKRYKAVIVPNIKALGNATITCDGRFTEGWVADVFRAGTTAYFSLGIYEPAFFSPTLNGAGLKKSFIGLDVSGMYGADPAQLPSTVAGFISSYLKAGDSVKVVVAGEGLMDTLPALGWYGVSGGTATSIQSALSVSRVLTAKSRAAKPRILFSDGGDGGDLCFDGVEKLATIAKGTSLYGSINTFPQYDIIATYWHGLGDQLSTTQLDALQKALNIFFARGGIFVEFFAYNRGSNNVASRFFTGLATPGRFAGGMLHRNIDGPIGHGFPNTLYYDNCAPLYHSDPDATGELVNEANVPVVISKKIGAGRFILSSMWHKQDNAGLKKVLGTTELNLQNQSRYFQLGDVVKNMVTTYGTGGLSEAVIMSNADFLTTADNMTAKTDPATFNAAAEVPYVKTISLLDGIDYIPPAYDINGQEYLGSGYWLKSIADRTGGSFFSLHNDTWNSIGIQIAPVNSYAHEKFSLSVQSGTTTVQDSIYNCQAPDLLYGNAHFYSGKTPFADTLIFNGTTKYQRNDSTYARNVRVGTASALVADSALISIFRIEILRKLLQATVLDSASIIRFAVQNRLLTDMTAFIALEPDDTTHFMKDPKDESKVNPVGILKEVAIGGADKIEFKQQLVNHRMVLMFSSNVAGNATVKIFTLAGRCIMTRHLWVVPGKAEYISFQDAAFSKGVYVGVAKFNPVSGKSTSRMERFTVR